MRDSVRALLPAEFRKAQIELYTDNREVSELIPLACRDASQVRRLVEKRKLILFTNRSRLSERPLVTCLSTAAPTPTADLRDAISPCGRATDAISTSRRTAGNGSVRHCGRPAEDLYTQSYVLPYLVPMLENAGACVLLPRETRLQRHEVLADNDAEGNMRNKGPGDPAVWALRTRRQVYLTGETPSGRVRRAGSERHRTGFRTGREWQATIPERGEYAVYVSYESTPEVPTMPTIRCTTWAVRTEFAVNQTMGGGTWIYLGHFRLPR